MASRSDLSRVYDMLQADPAALQPANAGNILSRYVKSRHDARVIKAVQHGEAMGVGFRRAMETQVEAAEQGTVVNAALEWMQNLSSSSGVVDKTRITFDFLNAMYHHCEPVAACVDTRIRQVQAYCRRPKITAGYVVDPGLKICMTIANQKPTTADVVVMQRLEQFLLETGFTEPPRSERPAGWQPGLDAFASAIIRDRLVLDWVAIRKWSSEEGSVRNGQWRARVPIVAFTWEDASRIRYAQWPVRAIVNGVRALERPDTVRTNTKGEPIEYVQVDTGGDGGAIMEQYCSRELAVAHQNVRSRRDGMGYGYAELERAVNAVGGWISGMVYNSSRFTRDSMPRGILVMLGQFNEQQRQAFQVRFMQHFRGIANRWSNLMLQGTAQAGAGVNWIPLDMSNRDMEYSQWLFTLALIIHGFYGIHPEETGYQAMSPFRPPLSEGSPQAKLQYAQDNSFAPLLRWFEGLLNREIVWKLYPNRRYCVRLMGVNSVDPAADVQLRTAMLSIGMMTPRQDWNERDVPVPEAIDDDPAMDMPAPWMQGRQLLMGMQQAQQAQQQQEQAMRHAADDHQQQATAQMQHAQQQQGTVGGSPDGAQRQRPSLPPGPAHATSPDNSFAKSLTPWED